MKQYVHQLVMLAKEKHGPNIRPCSSYNSFEECISIFNERITLWYNTPDDNTHTISLELKEV